MAMKQVIAWSLSRDTEVGGGGCFMITHYLIRAGSSNAFDFITLSK